ncbi:hypothetical protein FACS1894184_05220 [Clostridia bacterium]|nr:hypothetical protein FACS1894184_05220 [Clostridia bacterium]
MSSKRLKRNKISALFGKRALHYTMVKLQRENAKKGLIRPISGNEQATTGVVNFAAKRAFKTISAKLSFPVVIHWAHSDCLYIAHPGIPQRFSFPCVAAFGDNKAIL